MPTTPYGTGKQPTRNSFAPWAFMAVMLTFAAMALFSERLFSLSEPIMLPMAILFAIVGIFGGLLAHDEAHKAQYCDSDAEGIEDPSGPT